MLSNWTKMIRTFESYKKELENYLMDEDPLSFLHEVAFDAEYAYRVVYTLTKEEYNIINDLADLKAREILLATGLEVEYCPCGCSTPILADEDDYDSFDWTGFYKKLRDTKNEL